MRNLALLLASVAACAGSRDTPAKASPDTATIRVFEEGIGASGRIAVFQHRNGAVASMITTGPDGTATSPVRSGDLVTLANVGAPKFDLTTYVDLEPGDLGVVGEAGVEDSAAPSGGIVQVSLPAALPNAVGGQVSAGRSFTAHQDAPVAVQLVDTSTTGAGKFVVLGVATDAAGSPIAFSVLDATAGGSGAGMTLPAWRTDWDRVEVRVSNLTASAVATTRLDLLAGAARFPVLASPASSSTMLIPSGIGRAMDVRVSIADRDAHRDWRRIGSIVHETIVDGADLLPTITKIDVISAGSRPTVAWTFDAPPDAADVVVIRLSWGEGDAHRWTAIAPAGIRSFQFPALPDALAIWRPGADVRVGVGLIDSSAIAGYHDLMRHGIDELDDIDDGTTLRTSVSGHLVLTGSQ